MTIAIYALAVGLVAIGLLLASLEVVRLLRRSAQRRRNNIEQFYDAAGSLIASGVGPLVHRLINDLADDLNSADLMKGFSKAITLHLNGELSIPDTSLVGEAEFDAEMDQMSEEQMRLFMAALGHAVLASSERALVSGRFNRAFLGWLASGLASREQSQTVITLAHDCLHPPDSNRAHCAA